MRAPHDLDAILPEDTCKCFDLLAQLLISPIMAAADPEVDRLRMQLYDPLHLFLEPLVIFHGMPAAAAPHESLDLQRLLPVAGKGPRPLVERLKASRPVQTRFGLRHVKITIRFIIGLLPMARNVHDIHAPRFFIIDDFNVT